MSIKLLVSPMDPTLELETAQQAETPVVTMAAARVFEATMKSSPLTERISPLLPRVIHANSSDAMLSTGETAFDQLTCQLDDATKQALIRDLEALPPHLVDTISEAIRMGTYEKVEGIVDFSTPLVDDSGLQALRRGSISLCQYCSFMFLRSFMVAQITTADIKRLPLFLPSSEDFTPRIRKILDIDHWTAPQAELFRQYMLRAPITEQQLVLLPDTSDPDADGLVEFLFSSQIMYSSEPAKQLQTDDLLPRATILEALKRIKFYTFGSFNCLETGSLYRIVPSFWMMQMYIESLSPDTPCGALRKLQMCPVLGPSTPEIIEFTGLHQHQRIFALFHQRFPTPSIADGFIAGPKDLASSKVGDHVTPWGDFSYHDFYHASKVARLSEELRNRLAIFAHLLHGIIGKDPYLTHIYLCFIDLEYLHTIDSTDNDVALWLSLGSACEAAFPSVAITDRPLFRSAESPTSPAEILEIAAQYGSIMVPDIGETAFNTILHIRSKAAVIARTFLKNETELAEHGITRRGLAEASRLIEERLPRTFPPESLPFFHTTRVVLAVNRALGQAY